MNTKTETESENNDRARRFGKLFLNWLPAITTFVFCLAIYIGDHQMVLRHEEWFKEIKGDHALVIAHQRTLDAFLDKGTPHAIALAEQIRGQERRIALMEETSREVSDMRVSLATCAGKIDAIVRSLSNLEDAHKPKNP